MGTILEASGYIWVTVLGVIFLRERVSPRKLAGLAVIIIGIVVFNI
jgi:multidrug transporter EmrE-like cation transporter